MPATVSEWPRRRRRASDETLLKDTAAEDEIWLFDWRRTCVTPLGAEMVKFPGIAGPDAVARSKIAQEAVVGPV